MENRMRAEGGAPGALGRAPWVGAGPMTPRQRELVEVIRRDWGGGAIGLSPVDDAGRTVGPFALMVADPAVGHGLLSLLEGFTASSLTLVERELVILIVAAERRAAFMWHGHAPVLQAAGVSRAALDDLASGRVPRLDAPLDALHRFVILLVRNGDADDLDFDEAVGRLGWEKVQASVWLTGTYEMFALAMRTARTPLPEGVSPDDVFVQSGDERKAQ